MTCRAEGLQCCVACACAWGREGERRRGVNHHPAPVALHAVCMSCVRWCTHLRGVRQTRHSQVLAHVWCPRDPWPLVAAGDEPYSTLVVLPLLCHFLQSPRDAASSALATHSNVVEAQRLLQRLLQHQLQRLQQQLADQGELHSCTPQQGQADVGQAAGGPPLPGCAPQAHGAPEGLPPAFIEALLAPPEALAATAAAAAVQQPPAGSAAAVVAGLMQRFGGGAALAAAAAVLYGRKLTGSPPELSTQYRSEHGCEQAMLDRGVSKASTPCPCCAVVSSGAMCGCGIRATAC